MVDAVETQNETASPAERRPMPRWAITTISLLCALALWEFFGRNINPIFGSYPSAIAVAFWDLVRSGQLASALYESLRPFALGYGLAIVIGVPLVLLWLGLGFAVKVAVVFIMCLFPICINTWLGVAAVPKTLIEVGKSFVAPDAVILRRIVLPATLPYIMAGIRLAVARAVVG